MKKLKQHVKPMIVPLPNGSLTDEDYETCEGIQRALSEGEKIKSSSGNGDQHVS